MIQFLKGNMFEHDAQVLVNPVNCVGVMGAGLALAFARQFPEMVDDYKLACANKSAPLAPGRLHVWISPEGLTIVNLPTKRHRKEASRLADVEAGLVALREFLSECEEGVRVCVPALGCGLGGLSWSEVKPLLEKHLDGLQATVMAFEP